MVVLERRGDVVSRGSDWSAREQRAIGPCPDPSKSCWNILLSFTKSEWRPQPGTLSLKSTVFAADKETRRSREGLPAECWEVSEPRKATETNPWAERWEKGGWGGCQQGNQDQKETGAMIYLKVSTLLLWHKCLHEDRKHLMILNANLRISFVCCANPRVIRKEMKVFFADVPWLNVFSCWSCISFLLGN